MLCHSRDSPSKGLPREKEEERTFSPLSIVTEAIISSVTLADEINSHVGLVTIFYKWCLK